MIYKVVRYMNAPALEKPADLVKEFDTPGLHALIADLFETMYASHGIGIAAPQVDLAQRITVIDIAKADDDEHAAPEPIVLINPEIIRKEGKQTGEEGCLSIPGFREPVSRARKVTVRAQNVKGEWFEIEGQDLLARAFQHEIDHLNGILFITHLSALKRDLIKRKIRKMIKAGEWE